MWIDITMPLHNQLAVWPGDRPFRYTLDAQLPVDGANVGSVEMSLHAGTHVDAPFHYDPLGQPIDQLPLEYFVGPVTILDVSHVQGILTASDVKQIAKEVYPRVFFKTKKGQGEDGFIEDFTAIAVDTIEYLAHLGVQVIGTDASSVDALADEQLSAHHACRRLQLYIIENLRLHGIVEGDYDFIGLPLAIQGADASPIRAAIRKLEK